MDPFYRGKAKEYIEREINHRPINLHRITFLMPMSKWIDLTHIGNFVSFVKIETSTFDQQYAHIFY